MPPDSAASACAGPASGDAAAAPTVTKRIHIGGLTPDFSRDALAQKLASYGEVVSLEGCDDTFVDGVGMRRPFAFATLRATPAQIAKCMNTLSGAMWKKARLRVGEAKPRVDARYVFPAAALIRSLDKERTKRADAERRRAERADERRERRLRWCPWHAVEAPDMSAGWKETPAGHLVRPLMMRPDRPLPRPQQGVPASARPPGRSARRSAPPSRARRVTIDPTRYTREHLAGRMLDAALPDDTHASLRWVCVEEEGAEAPHATWKAIDRSGRVVHEEDAPTGRGTRALAAGAQGGASPTDARRRSTNTASPPPDDRDAVPSDAVDIVWEQDAMDDSDFSDGYDELGTHERPSAKSVGEERLRALRVLSDMLGEEGGEGRERTEEGSAGGAEITKGEAGGTEGEAEWTDGAAEWSQDKWGQAKDETGETEDEADETEGAADMTKDEADEADGTEDEAEETEDAADGTEDEAAEAAEAAGEAAGMEVDQTLDETRGAVADARPNASDAPHTSAPPHAPLAPTAGGGQFALFGSLAEEMEELDWTADRGVAQEGPAPAVHAPTARMSVQGMLLPRMATADSLSEGASNDVTGAVLRTDTAPFWCVDDEDAIDSRWRTGRGELTQTYKRMHREAVKKRRRRVVGARAGAGRGAPGPTRHAVAP
ncbi:hypothetical protein MSPP1_001022 [Malassezia sp. CBS 17886]|nr:hypothetical protein MSPP1_001022 [Malassezia sp. CBS 17886]